jgi:hypothetical protein
MCLSNLKCGNVGNECGKNKSNENLKTTNPSHNKDRPKNNWRM